MWNANVPASIKAYEEVNLDAMTVRQTLQNTHEFSIKFDDQTYVMNLYEFDLRSPDANAFIRDVDGNLLQVEKEDIKTYTGYVNNDKSNSVFLLASESDVAGFIKKSGAEIVIEPLRNYDANSDATKHIIYEVKTTSNVRTDNLKALSLQQLILPEAQATNDYLMRVIMDCDRQYYLQGTGNWQTRLLTLMGGITSDYATETSIGISVEDTVCDTSGSTYTSYDHHDLWDEVRDAWSGDGTTRHTVVMITGKDMTGSVSGFVEPDYSPPVSNISYGSYALVQAADDSSSIYGGTLQEQKQTLMHEMGGHIMGATHTDAEIYYTQNGVDYWTIMQVDIPYTERVMKFSTDNKSTIDSNSSSYLEDY